MKSRDYSKGVEWQCLILGMAAHCDLADLRRLFEGQELVLADGRAT